MGFTIGTPLNYMMLDNTKKEESNSALATLSLIRSIGTAIAPAIMIGFLAHAGLSVQMNVMDLLPKEISVPPLPYAEQLTEQFNKLKTDTATKDKFKDIDIPDLTSMQKIKIDMSSNSSYKMPQDLVELMKSSDVTTITANAKTLANRMFSQMTPNIISNINSGIDKGIGGMRSTISDMDKTILGMQSGYNGIAKGIEGMTVAINSQKSALMQLENIANMLSKIPAGKIPPIKSIVDLIPPYVQASIPKTALDELTSIKTIAELNLKITGLKVAITTLETKINDAKASQAGILKGIDGIRSAQAGMNNTIKKMQILKAAVPAAFNKAKENYIKEIGNKHILIENEFQKTLNGGFNQVYSTVAIASALAFLILLFYKRKKNETLA